MTKPAQLSRLQSAKRTKRDAGEEAFAAQSERMLTKLASKGEEEKHIEGAALRMPNAVAPTKEAE